MIHDLMDKQSIRQIHFIEKMMQAPIAKSKVNAGVGLSPMISRQEHRRIETMHFSKENKSLTSSINGNAVTDRNQYEITTAGLLEIKQDLELHSTLLP